MNYPENQREAGYATWDNAFPTIDANGDGYMSVNELDAVMQGASQLYTLTLFPGAKAASQLDMSSVNTCEQGHSCSCPSGCMAMWETFRNGAA